MLESVLSREAAKELFKDIKSVYANENKRQLLLQMRTNLSLDAGQLADSWLIWSNGWCRGQSCRRSRQLPQSKQSQTSMMAMTMKERMEIRETTLHLTPHPLAASTPQTIQEEWVGRDFSPWVDCIEFFAVKKKSSTNLWYKFIHYLVLTATTLQEQISFRKKDNVETVEPNKVEPEATDVIKVFTVDEEFEWIIWACNKY